MVLARNLDLRPTDADTYAGEESPNWLIRRAVTRGVRSLGSALDDFPDVPDFVIDAAGVTP